MEIGTHLKTVKDTLNIFAVYLASILKVLVVPAGYEQDVGSLPHVFDNQLRRFIGAHFVQQTYNWKNSIKKPTLLRDIAHILM